MDVMGDNNLWGPLSFPPSSLLLSSSFVVLVGLNDSTRFFKEALVFTFAYMKAMGSWPKLKGANPGLFPSS